MNTSEFSTVLYSAIKTAESGEKRKQLNVRAAIFCYADGVFSE